MTGIRILALRIRCSASERVVCIDTSGNWQVMDIVATLVVSGRGGTRATVMDMVVKFWKHAMSLYMGLVRSFLSAIGRVVRIDTWKSREIMDIVATLVVSVIAATRAIVLDMDGLLWRQVWIHAWFPVMKSYTILLIIITYSGFQAFACHLHGTAAMLTVWTLFLGTCIATDSIWMQVLVVSGRCSVSI